MILRIDDVIATRAGSKGPGGGGSPPFFFTNWMLSKSTVYLFFHLFGNALYNLIRDFGELGLAA